MQFVSRVQQIRTRYSRHVNGNFTQDLVTVFLSNSLDLQEHGASAFQRFLLHNPSVNTHILDFSGNELGQPFLQSLGLCGRGVTSSEDGGL